MIIDLRQRNWDKVLLKKREPVDLTPTVFMLKMTYVILFICMFIDNEVMWTI